MGVKTLPMLIERLLANGISPSTPALFVESASRAEERVIAASLLDLPAKVAAAGPSGPGLVLIGTALGRSLAYTKAAYGQALPAE